MEADEFQALTWAIANKNRLNALQLAYIERFQRALEEAEAKEKIAVASVQNG